MVGAAPGRFCVGSLLLAALGPALALAVGNGFCAPFGDHGSGTARPASVPVSGVGSKGTQPMVGKYPSTQAWASLVDTVNRPLASGAACVYPSTIRDGMSAIRIMVARLAAYCWQ